MSPSPAALSWLCQRHSVINVQQGFLVCMTGVGIDCLVASSAATGRSLLSFHRADRSLRCTRLKEEASAGGPLIVIYHWGHPQHQSTGRVYSLQGHNVSHCFIYAWRQELMTNSRHGNMQCVLAHPAGKKCS